MALYALEDFEELQEIGELLNEMQKALGENAAAVVLSRQTLGNLSAVTTSFARTAAANLLDQADKENIKLIEIELKLSEILDRQRAPTRRTARSSPSSWRASSRPSGASRGWPCPGGPAPRRSTT